jgi:hypothetical protein
MRDSACLCRFTCLLLCPVGFDDLQAGGWQVAVSPDRYYLTAVEPKATVVAAVFEDIIPY